MTAPETLDVSARPRLRRGVRLTFDRVRGVTVLLHPEGVLVPNETAVDVLHHCDGSASITAIADALGEHYRGVTTRDIARLVDDLRRRRLVEVLPADD